MKHSLVISYTVILLMTSCSSEIGDTSRAAEETKNEVRLITLNPGHFHAGLVYKYGYENVSQNVEVYAPQGKDLGSYLALIDQYNSRQDEPTDWVLDIYEGQDYLEKMLKDSNGNVLVVSGNNSRKIDYLFQAVENDINVLADKPIVIHPDKFEMLDEALKIADEKGLLVNDIMTERHEITSILQRKLSQNRELFGELVQGSPEEPAISKESVHFFSKVVSGKPLIRPAWFFDGNQQGQAIVDVSTHLVDLILWQCFPDELIDFKNSDDDVEVLSARNWNTQLSRSQFEQVTNEPSFPDYLAARVESDSLLNVAANGEFTFKVRGVHGKVSVKWGFTNPKGGDTHFSRMRGTKADLVIRQDEAQQYTPMLYIEPHNKADQEAFESTLMQALEELSPQYSGLSATPSAFGWEVQIPGAYREGHEEHFTRVTELYLQHLEHGVLPAWERVNLLTKYFITTQAYKLSN